MSETLKAQQELVDWLLKALDENAEEGTPRPTPEAVNEAAVTLLEAKVYDRADYSEVIEQAACWLLHYTSCAHELFANDGEQAAKDALHETYNTRGG